MTDDDKTRDDILRRMLKMPPKHHAPGKPKNVRSSRGKPKSRKRSLTQR